MREIMSRVTARCEDEKQNENEAREERKGGNDGRKRERESKRPERKAAM